MIDAAAAESARLVEKAHKTGSLGVGDASRWRSLQASLQAVGGLSKTEASISATGIGPLLEYANTSLAEMTAALPAHAKGAVDDLQSFLKAQGFDVMGDKGALGAAAARTKVAMTSDWANLAKTTQQGIIDATLVAMAGGQNPRDAARKMRGLVTDVGGITYGRALTIARTEMADLYDSSRIAYMKSTGVVDGWWWRARDDACPICQIQHGRKFAPDQHPNRHHNCRCLMVPLVDDDTSVGDYLPGKQRPRESIVKKLPKGWDPPKDLRTLIGLRDNPGWRPSLALVKPGTTIPGSKIPVPTPGWKAPKGWPDPPTHMDTPSDIGSHIVDKDGILHVTIADMPSNGAKYRLTDTGLDMALDVPNGKWIALDKQMLEGENTIGKWVYYRLTHGQAGDPIQVWTPAEGYPLPDFDALPNVPALAQKQKYADGVLEVNENRRYRLTPDGQMEMCVLNSTTDEFGPWKALPGLAIDTYPIHKYAYARLVDEVNTAGGMKVVQAAAKTVDDIPPIPPPPTKPVKVSKPKPTVEDPTGWVGKPAPVAPVAPVKPEPLGEAAFTTLVDEAKKRYAALGTGKTLEKSYNWSYFEKAMQGDTSAVDYLVQNKYLSSADAARWKAAAARAIEPADPTAAAAWARAMDEYAVAKAQHLADTKVWREANGLPDWEWLGFDDVRRHTDSEGPAWADRTMPRLTHSTPGLREMQEYTGSSFRPWNDELRDAWSGRGELRTWKAKTLKADKVMTPSPEDVILVRGTDAGEFRFPPTADEKVVDPVGWGFHRNAPPPPMESLVGTVQHQPGYWSTSAGETSGYAPHAPVQLKIRAPKGTPMAWAQPVSSFHHEREMIVARGRDFYVHAVYKRGNQWIVEVEVLPDGVDAASAVMSPPRPASVPFAR